jgi:S1-C subfamily serine protease
MRVRDVGYGDHWSSLPAAVWGNGQTVNLLDLAILLLVALAAYNGYRRGAALQLVAYAGLLAGLLIGAVLAPPISRLVGSPLAQAALALTILLSMASIGDAAGWLVGRRVWAIARRSKLRAVDASAGSAVAVLAVLLSAWFLGFNLVNGPFPSLSREIRGSAIIRGLDQALPRPPSVLAQVRQFLNKFGFPEVFADLPPAPVGPVDLPTSAEAREAGEKADQSTVRIVGAACGAIQEGSGFVAAADYVITNAHVVAGMKAPQVQEQNGGSHQATVVLFDPKLDIAILYVDADLGLPLELDPGDEGHGAEGAVLGYPGGGPLEIRAASVRRELDAIGRDIYGRSLVDRNVYELQSVVRPGNSGGPFVLLDGEVAGVVFAASTTDSKVGYAIASPQVVPLLDEAEGRTQAVSTDGCAR